MVIRSIQLYADYQELQNFEMHQLTAQQSDNTFLCTPSSAIFVCSPVEVTTHRQINQDHTQQSPKTQKSLDALCEKYQDIFSLHKGDIDHTKLL